MVMMLRPRAQYTISPANAPAHPSHLPLCLDILRKEAEWTEAGAGKSLDHRSLINLEKPTTWRKIAVLLPVGFNGLHLIRKSLEKVWQVHRTKLELPKLRQQQLGTGLPRGER